MKIYDKILLILHYRCYLQVNNLVSAKQFIAFDKVYMNMVNAFICRSALVNRYNKKDNNNDYDTIVDVFRIQHSYLLEQYNLLLFEFYLLGISQDKVEIKLKKFYQPMLNFFVERKFIAKKYIDKTEFVVLMVFLFLLVNPGTLIKKINFLMSTASLTDIQESINKYFSSKPF